MKQLLSGVSQIRRCHGFSLIKLLAAVSTIAVLAGLIIGFAGYFQRRTAIQTTRAQRHTIVTYVFLAALPHGVTNVKPE